MPQALDNIRVIEMTQALAGPYAAMMLGDLGADVIKIEVPGSGDQSRGWGPPFVKSESAYFLAVNRNKRSMTLNVKTPAGLQLLHRLLETADVLLTNNPRLESLQRLGLDCNALRSRYPRLIACNISGFGMTGPYAGRPGYDLVAQAMSGTMSLTGPAESEEPYRFPTAMADISAGIYAVIAILSALLQRTKSGEGAYHDISLLESQLTWLSYVASGYFVTGQRPARLGNSHPTIVPYDVVRARDKHFLIAVGTEKLWQQFCHALDLDHLLNDPRFSTNADRLAHRQLLMAELESTFRRRDASEWIAILEAAEVPCGPIQFVDEALNDTHVQSRNFIVEIHHPTLGTVKSLACALGAMEGAVTYRRHPPLLGEHTDEILYELGLTARDIQLLREEAAI